MRRAWTSWYGGFRNGITWVRVNGWPLGIGVWWQNTRNAAPLYRALRIPFTPYRFKLLGPAWEYRYAKCPTYAVQVERGPSYECECGGPDLTHDGCPLD